MSFSPVGFTEVIPSSLSRVSGVYAIVNVLTAKTYIGSAVDLFKRFHRHRSDLRGGVHRNCNLQSAYKIYDDGQYFAVVVETCPRSELLHREQEFMDLFEPRSLLENELTSTMRLRGKTVPDKIKSKIKNASKLYWSKPENRIRAAALSTGKRHTAESISKTVAAHVMGYDLISPTGERFTGTNRAEFCRIQKLNAGHLCEMFKGDRKRVKGWTLFLPEMKPGPTPA